MTVTRVAPIFPVRDLDAALEHYRLRGFTTRTWGEAQYGFACIGAVEIQLGVQPDNREFTPSSAYLHVEDADSLAETWTAQGIDVHPPEDTEWNKREGVVIDPDGNIIRFGSPLPR